MTFTNIAEIKIPDYLAEYMVRLYFNISERKGFVANDFERSDYLDDKLNKRVFSKIARPDIERYVEENNNKNLCCFSFNSVLFADEKPLRLYLVQYKEGVLPTVGDFRLASRSFVIYGSTIIIE
jgi:hypothetical protein